MKVNLVSFLDPVVYTGGGERVVQELLAEAKVRGHEVARSSVRWGKLSRLAGPRLKLHASPDLWLLIDSWNCPGAGRHFPRGFLEAIVEREPYVSLDNAWTSVCRRPDFPCAGNSSACPDPCERSRGSWLYGKARLAVFVSPLQRRTIEGLLRAEIARALEIPPTVDRSRFVDLGLSRDIPYLYVGTIAPYKGVLEVEELFGDKGLVWVGRNMLGRPMRGRELGVVSGGALVELYNRARRFVHLPAWVEPMGRTVVEAILCGCELVVNERVGALSWGSTAAAFRSLPDGAAVFWDRMEAVRRS